MDDLNADILETLKCPCCSEYMKSSIYICRSGHSVCNSCWKAKSCSMCKSPLTDTRNLSLESISNTVHYPCCNEESGCQRSLPLAELDEHHLVCDFRNYTCRLDKYCAWQGKRQALRKHYLDKHDKNILIGNESICLWKTDKPDYTIYLMMAYGEMFYVHAKIRNDIFYWTVQYIGRSEDIILFYFEIQIFTDQFNDRKLVLSEICHDDVVENISEIIDSGFCVAVPMSVFETYMTLEGAVFYKIEIKKA